MKQIYKNCEYVRIFNLISNLLCCIWQQQNKLIDLLTLDNLYEQLTTRISSGMVGNHARKAWHPFVHSIVYQWRLITSWEPTLSNYIFHRSSCCILVKSQINQSWSAPWVITASQTGFKTCENIQLLSSRNRPLSVIECNQN